MHAMEGVIPAVLWLKLIGPLHLNTRRKDVKYSSLVGFSGGSMGIVFNNENTLESMNAGAAMLLNVPLQTALAEEQFLSDPLIQ